VTISDSVRTIFNTNIPKSIGENYLQGEEIGDSHFQGKLVPGEFFISKSGKIHSSLGVFGKAHKWNSECDPKELGKLLSETLGENHPNTKILVALGLAILAQNKEKIQQAIKADVSAMFDFVEQAERAAQSSNSSSANQII
jgi:hypothetical protein